MPALYMYLADYTFADTQLKELEEAAEHEHPSPEPSGSHSGADTPYTKGAEDSESPSHTVQEVYRVESKHSHA